MITLIFSDLITTENRQQLAAMTLEETTESVTLTHEDYFHIFRFIEADHNIVLAINLSHLIPTVSSLPP